MGNNFTYKFQIYIVWIIYLTDKIKMNFETQIIKK